MKLVDVNSPFPQFEFVRNWLKKQGHEIIHDPLPAYNLSHGCV
jgi:hypothetical protein